MVKLKKKININDYWDFFKILAKKFIEFVQKNVEDEILFDYNSFATKDIFNTVNKKNSIIFDYSCCITFPKRKRDTDF